MDAIRRIGLAIGPQGLILLGGCTAGHDEAWLIRAAEVSGRRVRGCIGWSKGWDTSPDHPGLWAEADKTGSITYFETGDPKAPPKYTKKRKNPSSTSGAFIIHGDSHKYQWRQTKEGVVIYDESGRPLYIQDSLTGKLTPYDNRSSEKKPSTKPTTKKPVTKDKCSS